MKTLPVFLLLSALSAAALADNSLVVGAGQKITISAAQQSLTLDKFVMEDNATIEFAPDVTHWDVFAREASFGNNTTINGHGHNGSNGKDGSAIKVTTSADCSKVPEAINAINGEAGHDGVSIEMRLGIVRFKSLQIDVSGGNGGNGGKGAQGASGCKGIAGGSGGAAGNGGNSGHVLIAYWSASQDGYIPISNYGTGIQITINGGKTGLPGQGGEGIKSMTLNKEIKKGAKAQSFGRETTEPGKPGMPGQQGKNGDEGTFLVRPVTNAEMAKQVIYTSAKK